MIGISLVISVSIIVGVVLTAYHNDLVKFLEDRKIRNSVSSLPYERAAMSAAYRRGRWDCRADHRDGKPFESVGGIERIKNMTKPSWISDTDWVDYKNGYIDQAREIYMSR